MSAYLVESSHIAYLAQFAATDTHIKSRHGDALAIAEKLARANMASLRARYGDDGCGDPAGYVVACCADTADLVWNRFDPFEVIAAAKCYAYQACEVANWESTDAAVLIGWIKDHAIDLARGKRECKWGAPDPDGRRAKRKPSPMPFMTTAEYAAATATVAKPRRHGLHIVK
jgi:hypothetical protein